MQILQNIVCFYLDIHLWTGRKRLQPEDLKVQAGDIPPEKLASLGSKKICDPSELASFAALKKRAERACESVGIRFLGGYAIPIDKVDALVVELNLIKDEFENKKKSFLSRYDITLKTWIADNIEWSSILRNAVEPVDTVRRQLRFAHQSFSIGTASDDSNAVVNEGLENKVLSLGDRLLYEISRDAEKAWASSYRGKDRVTQKALRPIRSLLEKLEGLAFLDQRARVMADRCLDGLASLPKHGPIEGKDFNSLVGLVLQMADPEGIKALQFNNWGAPPIVEDDDVEETASIEAESPAPPKREPVSATSFIAPAMAESFQPKKEVNLGWF